MRIIMSPDNPLGLIRELEVAQSYRESYAKALMWCLSKTVLDGASESEPFLDRADENTARNMTRKNL